MTYMLDQLNSEDDTGRIEQLEAELQRVSNAFEEYISTSEGLEVDVNKELHEMRKLCLDVRCTTCIFTKARQFEAKDLTW